MQQPRFHSARFSQSRDFKESPAAASRDAKGFWPEASGGIGCAGTLWNPRLVGYLW